MAKTPEETKLHIGCGPVILPGWINIDLDHPDADMHHDITHRLPFPDGSVSMVFAEHLIEHITRDQAVAFLKECRRVLRRGGVVRMSTPSLEYVVDAYLARDTGRWGDLWQPANPCRLINEAFHSWGHQFLYDRREMHLLLQDAAFETWEFVNYRESKYPDLARLEARPFHHEIIVEATNGL